MGFFDILAKPPTSPRDSKGSASFKPPFTGPRKIYAACSGGHTARRRSKNAATSGGTDVKWTANPGEPSESGVMTLA